MGTGNLHQTDVRRSQLYDRAYLQSQIENGILNLFHFQAHVIPRIAIYDDQQIIAGEVIV